MWVHIGNTRHIQIYVGIHGEHEAYMCGYIWGTGHFYVWVLSMYVGNIGDIGGTCVWVYVANKAYMCVGTLETGSRYLTHTQHIITGVRCDLDSTSTDQERAFVYFRVTLQPVDLM